jgi:hypothetical protein
VRPAQAVEVKQDALRVLKLQLRDSVSVPDGLDPEDGVNLRRQGVRSSWTERMPESGAGRDRLGKDAQPTDRAGRQPPRGAYFERRR